MANPEHVEMVQRRAEASRKWRGKNPDVQLDLSEVNLVGAHFSGADLCGVALNGATIAEIDLRSVANLDSVNYNCPSTIGMNTLVLSQGAIPDVFLQGCGLQPWEILDAKMYDPALTPAEIAELQIKVFEKRTVGPLFIGGVFIWYSRTDSAFVESVCERLRKEGSPVWLACHDLIAGDLQKQVGGAIRLHDAVLFVLSESSTKSDWGENELDVARNKERTEQHDALLPIAIDESRKAKLDDKSSDRALWRTLTKKVILDFSGPAQFEDQFAKLRRGLKVNYPGNANRQR